MRKWCVIQALNNELISVTKDKKYTTTSNLHEAESFDNKEEAYTWLLGNTNNIDEYKVLEVRMSFKYV